ncbi:MAG TPA: hypothetical protein DCY35_01085 [Prolixibacteraceae bacterium]|nr:hypothetical protein [Prolixibacteraceae bacterium]
MTPKPSTKIMMFVRECFLTQFPISHTSVYQCIDKMLFSLKGGEKPNNLHKFETMAVARNERKPKFPE